MTKIYLVDLSLEVFKGINKDNINKNEELIINEAEKRGDIYTLEGFQNAFNGDEFYQSNNFILIKE